MDDLGAGLLIVLLAVITVTAGVLGVEDLMDKPEKAVIEACRTQGYWQYKQARVLCSIEDLSVTTERTNPK